MHGQVYNDFPKQALDKTMTLTQKWLQDPLYFLGIIQMPITQQWLQELLQ